MQHEGEGALPALVLENGGDVVIRLRPDLAPEHVERIAGLARDGFYDGVVFHRVIPGFMAQGGDPTGSGMGGSDLPDLAELADANGAIKTLGVDLAIAGHCAGADVVHSHTWYANMAGHLASLLHGIPHLVTAHSLEPMRPWKAEQLGGGYRLSSWAERTAFEAADAVIAVSAGMRADTLDSYRNLDPAKVHVVRNGIDPDEFAPDPGTDVVTSMGIDLLQHRWVKVGCSSSGGGCGACRLGG